MNKSMPELIKQAYAMLLDRSPEEAALIYHIAKLDNDLRGAIVIAYGFIKDDFEDHYLSQQGEKAAKKSRKQRRIPAEEVFKKCNLD